MENRLAVLALDTDKIVKVLDSLQVVLVDLPATLEHLHHDVVVDVGHEVGHLLVSKVEAVESVLHAFDGCKLVKVSDAEAPRLRELVLHSLQFPKEVVDLLEHNHHVLGEDG